MAPLQADTLFNRMFNVRPQEARRVMLLFVHLLCAVGAFIIGRNARDTLFLTHFSRDVLVYMYISQAAAVALPAWGYARYTNHFRRDRLLVWSLGGMAVLSLVFWALLFTQQGWVFVALYNFVEVMGALMMIQFWTFAGDVFSSREAKRIFPFIGGGGVLANVLVGGMIVAVVRVTGVEMLLPLMSVLLAVCMVCVHQLGRLETNRLEEQARDRRSADKKTVRVKAQAQGILQSTHLKIIAGMTCITFVTVQFVDFQFKSVTREAFKGPELAAFYGYFTIATGVVAAVAQFGLSARLLERFGVVVALAVLPVSILLGTSWVALAGASLWAVTFTQAAQTSFRYSIYDATMQVIYTPVPANLRGRAKTFIDGMLKPAAIGGAGILMWLLGNKLQMATASMAWVALVLSCLWLVLVLSIKREYVRELVATLRKRRLNFEEGAFAITDAATVEFLRRTLQSNSERAVRDALELLPRVEGTRFDGELEALLTHTAPDIRARAVALMGQGGTMASANPIAARFADEDADVRASAIRAYALIGRERSITKVVTHLKDEHAGVRAAAVAGLIAHGGLDGILQAADPLKRMLEDPDPGVREQAARVLQEIRVKNFYQPVLKLMWDENARVQQAAIAAAGEMLSPELIPALVYKLGERETASAAGRALARYGESVLDLLGKVLANAHEELAIRRQVPRILSSMGSPKALDVLLTFLGVPDPSLRREVARAVVRIKDRLPNVNVDASPVEDIITQEVRDAFELMGALADMDGGDGISLMRDSLRERLDAARERMFRLLAIVYPSKTVDLVYRNLTSPQQNVRANAVEVLDNMLSKRLKKVVIPLVEDQPVEGRLRVAWQLFQLERRSPEQWLDQLLQSQDPWLRVCAVNEVGRGKTTALLDRVRACLGDPDAVVRETAVKAVLALMPHGAWRPEVEGLREDRNLRVRAYATEQLAQPA